MMDSYPTSFDTEISPTDYKKLPKHPIYIILDNLRSAFNVGSIFRTCETARVEKIILCGYTAYPPHNKLEKTSMGTLPYVEWEHFPSTEEAIDSMKKKNITVLALETSKKGLSIFDFNFPSPVALILGNEAIGISESILNKVDGIVEIPLFGFKNSMNVASACAVAVFEVIRQSNNVVIPIKKN